ncbi:L-type lectin-domain containing protein [Micromonospora fulviviridis]|uniref:L-type lectin-domain containing protein n=1 Tax=Micromonospora fulviviridis TaxID=47860 RepID=A0ABV2VX41_9ACTN
MMILVVGVAGLGVSDAAKQANPLPVDSALAAALTEASTSCPALTPARLAGQVMAATQFEASPIGGIGGLSATQWRKWAPQRKASPSDRTASVLALAHLICDLVGRIRVSGLVGDPWRLAVAAWRSSVAAVKAAGGVPSSAAEFVEQVNSYADWYALQPVLGGRRPATPTAHPTPSAQPKPSASRPASPSPMAVSTGPAKSAASPPVRLRYPTFADSSSLHLNGSATMADGRLVLATGAAQAGSAWSKTKIDTRTSWTTSFAVEIADVTDGMAFVLQAEGSGALGGYGAGLGYGVRPPDPGNPINSSVAVELDAWSNSMDGFDPGQQHIAVTTNGDITKHLAWRDPGFGMCRSGPFHVWVAYDAAARRLQVWASQSPNRPAESLLSVPLDLAPTLGAAQAYIGFTGGTGRILNTNPQESVLSWTFDVG